MEAETQSGSQAHDLIAGSSAVWDMTLPWVEQYWDIEVLRRYHQCGYTFISATIQDMPASFDGVQQEVARFRALCEPHSDWLCFADSITDIDRERQAGRLVLGLNVQDTELVHDDLSRLQVLRELGVRHMLLAYQTRNRAADGCAEPEDAGLSAFGRDLVAEMNRVGMVVDVSHMGKRSSLDTIDASATPAIFSHSGVFSLCRHIRNIDDEQIRACAARGGVVGVVGIGAFLGDPDARAETMFRHIDYVAQLVGAKHVGIGTDFIDDMEWTWAGMEEARNTSWRDPYGTQLYEGVAFAPEQLVQLVELMMAAGYGREGIEGVLGTNFHRIYAAVERELT
ncbi:MAG: membrane dipeptidase [Pseudomonadota bacterium]